MRRLAMWSASAFLALLLVPAAGFAQEAAGPTQEAAAPDAQGARMVAAFEQWAAAWGVPDASIAVMRAGRTIGRSGLGTHGVADRESVASLSKAITGVCVVKLVEAGKLRYADRLGKLIPDYFRANKPADPAARRITVAELLTQTGGLDYDPTQGTAEFAALDFTKPNMPQLLKFALNRKLGAKSHFYNNINYLALGLVIESVTGESFERHCRKSVLAPVGADAARLSTDWRILSSYGGWSISALDYARFLDHFRPGSKLLKSKPTAWPKVDLGGGAYYSIGVYLKRSGSSWNVWHSGGWIWNSPTAQASFGGYFGVIGQNLRFAVNFEPRPSDEAYVDLDFRVFTAANPTIAKARVRPAPDLAPAGALGGSDRGEADRAIGASGPDADAP